MTATTATATRGPAPSSHEPRAAGSHSRHAGTRAPHRRPSDLPREYRIVQVYRTLGSGLVAEYDPD
jgi:hypothetical protein